MTAQPGRGACRRDLMAAHAAIARFGAGKGDFDELRSAIGRLMLGAVRAGKSIGLQTAYEMARDQRDASVCGPRQTA